MNGVWNLLNLCHILNLLEFLLTHWVNWSDHWLWLDLGLDHSGLHLLMRIRILVHWVVSLIHHTVLLLLLLLHIVGVSAHVWLRVVQWILTWVHNHRLGLDLLNGRLLNYLRYLLLLLLVFVALHELIHLSLKSCDLIFRLIDDNVTPHLLSKLLALTIGKPVESTIVSRLLWGYEFYSDIEEFTWLDFFINGFANFTHLCSVTKYESCVSRPYIISVVSVSP
jgi:hypothetical protein